MSRILTDAELGELQSLAPEERRAYVRSFTDDVVIDTLLALFEWQQRHKSYHKKSYTKKQLILKSARQFLSPDELAALADRAQEIVDGL